MSTSVSPRRRRSPDAPDVPGAELDPDRAPRGHGGRGARGGHGHRLFGRGGLRLALLRLIADEPRHGYELIKSIEEQVGGRYSPSPGVVYPTLTLLEEMGLVAVDAPDLGGRKRYHVSDEGRRFLVDNAAMVDAVMARMHDAVDGAGPRAERPPQVARAIENLKLALRLRLSRGPLSDEQANAFAAVLDHAAQQLERIG